MRAVPPSSSSSVESRRTSVDLPEPFWPRMATHSPRSIEKVTGLSALTQRRRRRRPSRRRKSLRRQETSTAGTARSKLGCERTEVDDTLRLLAATEAKNLGALRNAGAQKPGGARLRQIRSSRNIALLR